MVTHGDKDAARKTRRRGRPSVYYPARCDEIIAIMSEGYTVTAAAGIMGVSRLTLYRWVLSEKPSLPPETASFLDCIGFVKSGCGLSLLSPSAGNLVISRAAQRFDCPVKQHHLG